MEDFLQEGSGQVSECAEIRFEGSWTRNSQTADFNHHGVIAVGGVSTDPAISAISSDIHPP
jgi:hypothetical protein